MAVTHTASSTPQSTAAAADPQTFTALINIPDTTGIAIVGISLACLTVEPSTAIVGVTLGGATVNLLDSQRSGAAGSNGGIWLGYVKHSVIGSTGNKNLVVDITGTVGAMLAGVSCFSGHDDATPFGTPAGANGQSINGSVGITDSATGDMVVGLGCYGTAITSMTQTQRWLVNLNSTSACGNLGMNTAAGAAGTVTMGMNHAVSESWAMNGVTIKQASAVPIYTQTKFQLFNNDGTGTGPA